MDTPQIPLHIQKRIELQKQGVDAYIATAATNRPYRIAFYYGTGIGKSKTAIDCVTWYTANVKAGRGLIICHSTGARDITWPKELKDWKAEGLVHERVCYQSLPKISGQHFDWVIMDEAHKNTERTFRFFQFNKVDSIIVLTATEPRKTEKRQMLAQLVGKNHMSITADEAIDMGILNDYTVDIFEIDLDDTERYLTWRSYDPVIYTEKELYFKHCVFIQTMRNEAKYDSMRRGYIALMRFLGTCRSKTKACIYLMNRLKERKRKFLVFAAGKEQAAKLGTYIYHSDTDDSYYRMFLNDEIDHLISINQIQEGANIDNLEKGIMVQVDTDPQNTVQRIGRFLRLSPELIASCFFICVRNTFDQQWIKKALKKNRSSKIKRYFLEPKLYW